MDELTPPNVITPNVTTSERKDTPTVSIDDTFDILNVGDRIRSACFFDGPENRWIVQFFRWRGGEIIRASYDRRTTKTEERRIPRDDWHHAELEKMYWGERLNYSI